MTDSPSQENPMNIIISKLTDNRIIDKLRGSLNDAERRKQSRIQAEEQEGLTFANSLRGLLISSHNFELGKVGQPLSAEPDGGAWFTRPLKVTILIEGDGAAGPENAAGQVEYIIERRADGEGKQKYDILTNRSRNSETFASAFAECYRTIHLMAE